jgi:[ribosomal protein S18]-alanine N-acetyltransferase
MKPLGEVSIRRAGPEDIEAVVLLGRTLDTLPHWPASEYRAAIAVSDSRPLRCLLVAEVDGPIVGVAVARVDCIAGECTGELESVGVASSAQRRGIGRELCRSVIRWCESQGASHVDLEVRSQSAGAVALYRELGFVAAGKRRNYYRDPADDAILMRLVLKREPSEPAPPAQPVP